MLKKILPKLYSVEHIPSHPVIKRKLEDILIHNKKDTNCIEALMPLIIFDPSLTMEFLRIANSQSFCFQNKISSLEHALLILDNELIRLIIKQHPGLTNQGPMDKIIEKEFRMFIKHSIEVRIILENMLKGPLEKVRFKDVSHEEFLTSAILHDIGFFYTLIFSLEEHLGIRDSIKQGNTVLRKNMKQKIFTDHDIIGAVLCEYWNLPNIITSAISFHHYPWGVTNKYRVGAELIYMADNLSDSYYEINFGQDDIYSVDEHIIMKKRLMTIFEKYGLNMVDIAGLRIRSTEESQTLFAQIGLE